MTGRRKVLAPHAELGVSLADGTCSLIVCLPHAALYPNDGAAELVNSAHGAESRPVREQMLAHCVLTPHAALYPNDGAVELVNSAHGAGGRPVRWHMLAHRALAAHTVSVCHARSQGQGKRAFV